MEDDDLTTGVPYRKQCVIDDEVAVLDVLDTTGQEEYSAMREQYLRTGKGFLLLYSITSRWSFDEIKTFTSQILKIKDKDYFPMIIVGSKCKQVLERQVSFKEGQDLANSIGCPFLEADSSDGPSVERVFYDLVREIRR